MVIEKDRKVARCLLSDAGPVELVRKEGGCSDYCNRSWEEAVRFLLHPSELRDLQCHPGDRCTGHFLQVRSGFMGTNWPSSWVSIIPRFVCTCIAGRLCRLRIGMQEPTIAPSFLRRWDRLVRNESGNLSFPSPRLNSIRARRR